MKNGGDFHERTAPEKALQSYSEKPTAKRGEPDFVKSVTGRMSESSGDVEALGSNQEEAQLMDAKNTVEDLRLKIEQSNSRAKAQMDYLVKVKRNRKGSGDWGMSNKNHQSMGVMKELEDVKQELSKLKLDMASLLEEKRRAEKEAETSKLKVTSFSSSAETLRKEIDKINEEQVLVELARIEAMKERTAVESYRKQDGEKYSADMEERRQQMNQLNQEIDAAKDLERELAVTLADVNMLESELKQAKEIDKIIQGKGKVQYFESDSLGGEEPNHPHILGSITKEIETAKKELASVKEESFRFMASMDIIRTELRNVSEEAARVKRREEKTELAIQNLNAKLLRGRAKVEAASSAEEKAKKIVSNLSRTLEQYKTETEAARKEGSLIKEETRKIKQEIDKIESDIETAEEKLQTAIEELKSIKSSELKALESLKTLTETTMRNRASASQHSSVITISKFEYEYLKDCAAGAEEIADKKVAAAQAWIEALKASEREILMKTEKARKENRAQELKGKKVADGTQQSPPEKRVGETEIDNWMQNHGRNVTHDKMQHAALSRRSSSTSGKITPVRRGKHRVSMSPGTHGTPRSASFAVRRRTKVMPNLAKLFSGKTDGDRNE